jgi:hypothetical protein
MNDFYTEYMQKQKKRNKLEQKLDEYNHIMELMRTLLAIIMVSLQLYIISRLL